MVLYLKTQLSKVYQGKFSIEKISFLLKSGDLLGLIGRSGSGKSTIIKAIVGAIHTYHGKIELYEDSKLIDTGTSLGYSPQDNALYPLLTLKENIYTFGKLNRMKNSDIETRMNMLLGRLGLANSKDKLITQLSGGMQKRADLACALIHDPKVIILDEPFNGIDISLQMFIWKFIKELSAEGKIIILSSHMLEDLQKNCNQFGLVENGKYYDTIQIAKFFRNSREKDLESFLTKVFSGGSLQGDDK
jgi:ABC-type multidrug transport system ATPase subunit